MKQTIKWKITAINPEEFELNIEALAKDRLFLQIFKLSKNKLLRKGIKVNEQALYVKNFSVPQQYFNILRLAVRRTLKIIQPEIKKDHFAILDYWVTAAYFMQKENKDWIIKIEVSGLYAFRH